MAPTSNLEKRHLLYQMLNENVNTANLSEEKKNKIKEDDRDKERK